MGGLFLCPPTIREEATHVALVEIVTIGHECAANADALRKSDFMFLRYGNGTDS